MKGKKTRTQVIERVASLAMQLGGRHLADFGATRSRHDFTQRQLMACLILRAYLKTTYRGVLELLAISPNLREALGLHDKLPHYTTLQKFSARSQVLAIADAMIRKIGRSAGAPAYAQGAAAMDVTGLETTTASATPPESASLKPPVPAPAPPNPATPPSPWSGSAPASLPPGSTLAL